MWKTTFGFFCGLRIFVSHFSQFLLHLVNQNHSLRIVLVNIFTHVKKLLLLFPIVSKFVKWKPEHGYGVVFYLWSSNIFLFLCFCFVPIHVCRPFFIPYYTLISLIPYTQWRTLVGTKGSHGSPKLLIIYIYIYIYIYNIIFIKLYIYIFIV